MTSSALKPLNHDQLDQRDVSSRRDHSIEKGHPLVLRELVRHFIDLDDSPVF